jgi:hypothetical protein
VRNTALTNFSRLRIPKEFRRVQKEFRSVKPLSIVVSAGTGEDARQVARPDQFILKEEEFVWARVDETRRPTRRFPPAAAHGAYNQADRRVTDA